MHDDDSLGHSDFSHLPDKYWNEHDWEKYLMDNERLIDRYEKVFEENPERVWDDPADLYYKVHYGIDLGEDLKFPEQETALLEAPESEDSPWTNMAEDPEDDLDNIPAYQLAFKLSLALHEFMKTRCHVSEEEDHLVKDLCFHGFRVAANIAGGHGLGYEEDSLCGNIVKNRWALEHAGKVEYVLGWLQQIHGPLDSLQQLSDQVKHLQQELHRRIADLRTKVWW